jgi:hypothetical protein
MGMTLGKGKMAGYRGLAWSLVFDGVSGIEVFG